MSLLIAGYIPGYAAKPAPRYVTRDRMYSVQPNLRLRSNVIPFPDVPRNPIGTPRTFMVLAGGKAPRCIVCSDLAHHGHDTFCTTHWSQLPRYLRSDFIVTRNIMRRALLLSEARPFLH